MYQSQFSLNTSSFHNSQKLEIHNRLMKKFLEKIKHERQKESNQCFTKTRLRYVYLDVL